MRNNLRVGVKRSSRQGFQTTWDFDCPEGCGWSSYAVEVTERGDRFTGVRQSVQTHLRSKHGIPSSQNQIEPYEGDNSVSA